MSASARRGGAMAPGAGEMTVCRVIEDDAGIDLRVPGDWVKPWEVTHRAVSALKWQDGPSQFLRSAEI